MFDRISRTWDLMSQSLDVLRSDKELMWLPICSAIACIAITVVMLSGGTLLFLPQLRAMGAVAPGEHPQLSQGMWVFTVLFYIANYCIVIFFNVALISIASDRIAGGHATMNDGLQAAWQRKWVILQWAILAATVGVLLRALEDRMGWLGRLVIGIIGITWTLATYLVVPVIAAEGLGPSEALARSAQLFTETWGEQLVGGFSFGVIFMLLGLPAVLLPIYGATLGRSQMILGTILAVVYWLMLAVINATVQGIFMAALYRYATTKEVPPGFNGTDLQDAWQPRT
ncbi:MAG: hypothetical protein KGL59_16255 [Acidobacteriota bacterium]|nr:hypothetical protein [Acidobacteriota bacterium]